MDITQEEKIILTEIEEAMKSHELQAYYQPLYDALSNKMVSAEALVRWVKKDGTVVSPAYFIPVLEKCDAILAVDWFILEESCKLLRYQIDQQLNPVPLSVNFSRMHLMYENTSGITEKLCNIVDSYNLEHKWIEIEITETAFINQPEAVTDLVKAIRDLGFKVAIDDFGSGLSSLSFVKDVEVDTLKIDRSLLSKNCETDKERILLESIFNFAHRLRLTTVAEGVETKEQLGFLRTCDCKKIQGFLFAKPEPIKAFVEDCKSHEPADIEDILQIQAPSSATQMLLDVVFMKYPLVILCNLSRNSYYMMTYENFTTTKCTGSGIYDELIAGGATTMHPDDRDIFLNTFSIENQIKKYEAGEKCIRIITRQMGDDGIYRRVETINYFVSNPATNDVLVITLCENLD